MLASLLVKSTSHNSGFEQEYDPYQTPILYRAHFFFTETITESCFPNQSHHSASGLTIMAPGHIDYQPVDALWQGIKGAGATGSVGAIIAATQNTLTRGNVSAWGVFTKFGGTMTTFAAVGGTYELVRTASANLREREDAYNTAIGGFLAGSILGLKIGTTPAVLGWGSAAAVLLGAYDYTGGRLNGTKIDPDFDKFEEKQNMRRNRRRPIEETVAELGEGRGIYAPGYDERRRQRLKEKYDIDVPVPAKS